MDFFHSNFLLVNKEHIHLFSFDQCIKKQCPGQQKLLLRYWFTLLIHCHKRACCWYSLLNPRKTEGIFNSKRIFVAFLCMNFGLGCLMVIIYFQFFTKLYARGLKETNLQRQKKYILLEISKITSKKSFQHFCI